MTAAISPARADVLVAGAGPTGLVLALWLTRLGATVRIVDAAAEPGTTSRAVGVQARTLELYRQVALSDALVENGVKVAGANLWVRGAKAARIPFERIGAGLSPFPFLLVYPQDEHERLLIGRLAALGVTVERPVELVRFEQDGDGVSATLRRPDGSEEICEAGYLAGCDGARSHVREAITSFPGGTYAHTFYVADVDASGPATDREVHVELDDADFLAIFPLTVPGRVRLIGAVQPAHANGREPLTFDDIGQRVLANVRLTVRRVNWFSTYRVHHRVAQRFRDRRVFLLGDAAHIHSPVGGQGMNTGIGDAVNLAWKLASVASGDAPVALLDTYEPERIAFARRLVATTDRVFTMVSATGRLARFVRMRVMPAVAPRLVRFAGVRRFAFRTISQTGIRYRESRLSEGAAGSVHGGDRLPWVEHAGGTDNFAPLTSLAWQVHVYGVPRDGVAQACSDLHLPLHVFGWNDGMRTAGLARDALYLVRPDGYVALADASADPARLRRYLAERELRPASRHDEPREMTG